MAVKTERIEARLAPQERDHIERAASLTGVSTSAFIVSCAIEHASVVIANATTTVVPSDYFDELLAALDAPAPAPRLADAVKRVRNNRRVRLG